MITEVITLSPNDMVMAYLASFFFGMCIVVVIKMFAHFKF